MIWLIIAAVIIAISLLRVGATAEYSEDGPIVLAHAGFLTIRIFPKKPKRKRREKREKIEPEKKKKKEKHDEETTGKKPGSSVDFKKLLSGVTKVLGKIKRRLYIKELTVFYVQAGGDPYKMATTQGTALAALGLTQAALESFFRIKRYNLHTSVDFIAEKSRVYVRAKLSIAIWQVVSIAFAALMLVLRSRKPKKTADVADKSSEDNTSEEKPT